MHTAMRILSRNPDIARADHFTAVVCGEADEVERQLKANPSLASRRDSAPDDRRSGGGGFGDLYRTLGAKGWEPLLYLCFTRLTIPAVAENAVMIARMLLPFRLGLGGRVGSGDQWWSWVTLDDLVAAYVLALGRPLAGIFNVAAPGVVRNREFVDTFGEVLHRPTVFPLPASAVRLVLGDMGDEFLLGGQRAVPARLTSEGFSFAYPELRPALEHVLRA